MRGLNKTYPAAREGPRPCGPTVDAHRAARLLPPSCCWSVPLRLPLLFYVCSLLTPNALLIPLSAPSQPFSCGIPGLLLCWPASGNVSRAAYFVTLPAQGLGPTINC